MIAGVIVVFAIGIPCLILAGLALFINEIFVWTFGPVAGISISRALPLDSQPEVPTQ